MYPFCHIFTKEAFKTQTWWGKKNFEWGGGQSPDDIDDDDNDCDDKLARAFHAYPFGMSVQHLPKLARAFKAYPFDTSVQHLPKLA